MCWDHPNWQGDDLPPCALVVSGRKKNVLFPGFWSKVDGFSPNSFSYMGVLTSSWGVRVRRFCGFVVEGGLSHSASFRGVIRGPGFADLREGCHGGCRWCHLMRVRVGVRSIIYIYIYYIIYMYM